MKSNYKNRFHKDKNSKVFNANESLLAVTEKLRKHCFFSGDYEKEVNCSQQVVMFVTIKSSQKSKVSHLFL